MSLLFNMLSRLVITFLPRSKCLLISWLQSPSAVILEPKNDGWMASPTQWTWVWVDSRSWWWAGRPSVLQFMGSQRVGHNWATKLNWTYVTYTEMTIYFAVRHGKCNRPTCAILGLWLNNTLNISCKPGLPCKNNIISDFCNADIWKQIMTFVDMVIMSKGELSHHE